MTERRRSLDNDDGQESLFGAEAFAPAPRTPAPWTRSAPAREHDARMTEPADATQGEPEAPRARIESGATSPLDETASGPRSPVDEGGAAFEAGACPPFDEAGGAFEAGARPPFDEAQADRASDSEPSVEDLAAYGFEADVSASPADAGMLAGAAPTEVPAPDAGEELAALERATVAGDDVRRPRVPLAGPTLDDVMSRVWEGLVTGLPAACPVCHGEVVPSYAGSLHGACSSCGTTID